VNNRISITPDSFTSGPLLCLVPNPKDLTSNDTSLTPLSHLRSLEVALFSRLEQLDKASESDAPEEQQSRVLIERERQMLKQALDWCASSSAE
jgi:hypothetical protein